MTEHFGTLKSPICTADTINLFTQACLVKTLTKQPIVNATKRLNSWLMRPKINYIYESHALTQLDQTAWNLYFQSVNAARNQIHGYYDCERTINLKSYTRLLNSVVKTRWRTIVMMRCKWAKEKERSDDKPNARYAKTLIILVSELKPIGRL